MRDLMQTLAKMRRRESASSVLMLCSTLYIALFLAACVPPADGGAAAPTPKGFIFSTVYFILMVVLVYFVLVIHPARLKEETQNKFIQGLKKNDEVVTSGGIFARVAAVKPEYITLEVAQNVKIKVEPRHVRPPKKVDSSPPSDQDKSPATKK